MTKDKFYEEMDKGAEQARNHPAYEEEGRELAIYASHERLTWAIERLIVKHGYNNDNVTPLDWEEWQEAREALAEAKALTGGSLERRRSTGVIDKNGVEVFEGDLCKIYYGRAINNQQQFTLNRVLFKNAEFIWGPDENPNPLQRSFTGCEGCGVWLGITDGDAFVVDASALTGEAG